MMAGFHKNLVSALDEFVHREVGLGSVSIQVCSASELDEMQLGYSRHPNGHDLTGSEEGDWLSSWVVFATDGSCGDPFFVDQGQEGLPVFTAMIGMGTWSAICVSPKLSAFLKSLSHLGHVSSEGGGRIFPSEKTITDEAELLALKDELCRLNEDDEFWTEFIEYHIDWVEESQFD